MTGGVWLCYSFAEFEGAWNIRPFRTEKQALRYMASYDWGGYMHVVFVAYGEGVR